MINIRRGASGGAQGNDLLSEEEVASILGVDFKAIRRMRYERRGPPTIKVGRAHRIRRAALEEWLSAREG